MDLGWATSTFNDNYYKSYWKFDFSTLDNYLTTITDANLYYYAYTRPDIEGNPWITGTYGYYNTTSDWVENTITWNNQPTSSTLIGTEQILHATTGWITYDVTEESEYGRSLGNNVSIKLSYNSTQSDGFKYGKRLYGVYITYFKTNSSGATVIKGTCRTLNLKQIKEIKKY